MKLQMLGPLFVSRADMGFDLFSWLACRDLNEEEVALTLYSEFVVNIGFSIEFSIAFEPNLLGDKTTEPLKGSGMLKERRVVNVPNVGKFQEKRVWISVRAASGVNKSDVSNIGVIVSDFGHMKLHLSKKHWQERGILPTMRASGVGLFQMLAWNLVDTWYNAWEICLEDIEKTTEVNWESVENHRKLRNMMRSDDRSEEAFIALQLLSVFRKQMYLMPLALRRMYNEWEETYEGRYSKSTSLIDSSTQIHLLENWVNLLSHADRVYAKLSSRLKGLEADLRSIRTDIALSANLWLDDISLKS
ncbi:hypothetical protein PG990_007252 [Apiospora arundinis]